MMVCPTMTSESSVETTVRRAGSERPVSARWSANGPETHLLPLLPLRDLGWNWAMKYPRDTYELDRSIQLWIGSA